ncbi:MAG TPA: hypothetical protein VIO38_07225 [Rariglobus sp.]
MHTVTPKRDATDGAPLGKGQWPVQRFQIIEALGLTVVPVEGLRDCVCYVPSQGVVLIRPNLDAETCDLALDHLIQIAALTPRGR